MEMSCLRGGLRVLSSFYSLTISLKVFCVVDDDWLMCLYCQVSTNPLYLYFTNCFQKTSLFRLYLKCPKSM